MKYLKGFLMAWGNFTAIPCPYRKWHEEARRAMLAMLPLVGVVLSAITIAVWALLDMIGAPAFLTGALLTATYFCLTGFIHLDGFMDCSDAILSRRPLAEKQRILKDSTVGAFAVVSLALMLLVFVASMTTLAEDFTLRRASIIIIIMAISRGVAAGEVCNMQAMDSSQYADISDGVSNKYSNSRSNRQVKKSKKNFKPMEIGECIVLMLTSIVPAIIMYFVPDYLTLRNTADSGTPYFEMYPQYMGWFFAVLFITMAAAYFVGAYDRKQLGGMSGDIAGHVIVSSEMIGVVVAALLASFML